MDWIGYAIAVGVVGYFLYWLYGKWQAAQVKKPVAKGGGRGSKGKQLPK